MRIIRLTVLLTTLTIAAPAAARAQASLAGVVKDASGASLPMASIEAASAALIEKTRTAHTDSSGQFRIVDLRPGVYSVVVTLQGFATARHEGVELAGSGTVTVNTILRAGAAEEAVTVAGGNATVDVQSVTRQTTISNDVINTIPNSRSYGGLMVLVPGIVAASADSQVTPRMLGFRGSGGRGGEGRLEVDGLSTAFVGGSGVSAYVADLQNSVEVSFTISGGLGEAEVSGPAVNVVPRTGSNAFRGSFYAAGVNEAMVGSNYTQALKDAGLSTPDALLKVWDLTAGAGGPILKDRFWFFVTARNQGSDRSTASMFANRNAGDPAKWTYAADETRPAVAAGSWSIGTARLTAQVTPRNKINLYWDEQIACAGASWSPDVDACRRQEAGGRIIAGGSQSNGLFPAPNPTAAPETASYMGGGTPQRVQHVTWQSIATSRLLFDAGFGTYLVRSGGQEIPGNPTRDLVRVTEQCSVGCASNGGIAGLVYRSNNWASNWDGRHNWRASASYVTGAHMLKLGYQGGYLVDDGTSFTNNQNLAFRFDNGAPNQLTETVLPYERSTRTNTSALYVQEQWTRRRMTLQGALRFDRASSWFPAAQIGPTRFLPTPLVFQETKGVDSYRDLTPRLGVVYDLFGNARTSIKVNLGRYLELASTGSNYGGPRPTSRVATTVVRRWIDGNRNFEPDCDLLNPLAQDSRAAGGDMCGQVSDLSFGQPVFNNAYDPALLSGWGVRPSDWSFGASVQHELMSHVMFEAGYFRRWLDGFSTTDNRAQAPGDFGTFSITAPLDARLPGGGGYAVSGLYNANQNVASSIDNFVTTASSFGQQTQRYNGLLINMTARPRDSLMFQGGINTGKTVADSCEIRARLPEIAPLNPYCHTDTGFVTRLTGLGSYTIPRVHVQLSGTFRSDPGVALVARYTVDGAEVAKSLGRPLSNGAANVTVNLIEPGSLYGDRVNDVSVRFAKILRYGRTRTNVGLDINNILNSATVLSYNEAFVPGGAGPWLPPTSILQPRYLKISAQVEF